MSINKVIVSGNLGSDPELRATKSGLSVLSFNVAVNERTKDSDGNWTDRVNWVSCTMFGTRAEKVARYLSKGDKVAIEGRLHYSSWDDRDTGNKRSKLDVTVDDIEFMSRREEGGRARAAKPEPQTEPGYEQAGLYDDDIPF